MAWRITLCKVTIEEEEYSLHENLFEALVAAGELEDEMGLDEPDHISLQRHPVTGELFIITIEGGNNG